jgi:dynein heavy chain
MVINTKAYKSYASFRASIDEVEAAANKERDIILSLSEISDRYMGLSLAVVKESTKFHIIKSFDRQLSILESDLLAINTLKNTNGLEKFHTLFDELELKLEMAKLVLTNWEAVQLTMNSVSKFFLSGEVRLQLSGELRKYERIEAAYKSIILSAQTHKKLSIMIDTAPDLASSLMDMLQTLRGVVSNLQGWLDNKRLIFPRLFFVSDEELLDIVSEAKQPKKLQPYFSR